MELLCSVLLTCHVDAIFVNEFNVVLLVEFLPAVILLQQAWALELLLFRSFLVWFYHIHLVFLISSIIGIPFLRKI